MNGYSRFRIPVAFDRSVNVIAIHPFSPVFGQKRRMNVNNAVWKGPNNFFGNFPKKAGEYDQVGIESFQNLENAVGIVKGYPIEIQSTDTQSITSLKNFSIFSVG